MLTELLEVLRHTVGICGEDILLFGDDPSYLAWYHSHPEESCFRSQLLVGQSWLSSLSGFRPLCRTISTRCSRSGKRARREYLQTDALIVTGGGTINTRDEKGYSLKRMHSLVALYHKKKRGPILMGSQTVGPLGVNAHHDRLARKILESADLISTRDCCFSASVARSIAPHIISLEEGYDDACELPFIDAPLPDSVEKFFENGEPVISFNVTEYTSDTQEKLDFSTQLVQDLSDRFSARILMLAHTPDDYEKLSYIFSSLNPHYSRKVLCPDTRSWRAESLKKAISRTILAIGGRYHFIVFAGTARVPFVGLCGNNYSWIKQVGFARQFGFDSFILDPEGAWNRDKIHNLVERAVAVGIPEHLNFERPSIGLKRIADALIRLRLEKATSRATLP